METWPAYRRRKQEELLFLASFLARPPALPEPPSVEAVVEQKFYLAAALKAERALADWRRTETSWADDAQPHRIGRYDIRSSYRRADLTVAGPPIYGRLERVGCREIATVYAASGMSSISALLAALGRILPGARLIAPAGAYGETLEAAAHCGGNLRLDEPQSANRPLNRASRAEPCVVLVDSCVPARLVPPARDGRCDLVVFDTTCLSAGSARIRRVLSWAESIGAPVALVRSHAKLDSLGIEYGRLGSTVLLAPAQTDWTRFAWLERLDEEIGRAVRLFGVAPAPASLPPFAGDRRHALLNDKRIARIVANGRRIMRRLIRRGVPVTSYPHGLYGVLRPPDAWTLERAKQAAGELADDLRTAALPARHAGSFGFDFFAMDGFPDLALDRHGVRLAFSDAPGAVADDVSDRVARWWTAHILNAHPDRWAA